MRSDLPRLIYLNARYLVFFLGEWLNERRYGISTHTGLRGAQDLDASRLVGRRAAANPYEGTPYGSLRKFFDALPEDLSAYTFVDFGSGKGRALIVAAERGFQQVIGVEFAEDLHEAAMANAAKSPHAARIRPVLCDAGRFAIPSGPLVLYFCNPFTGELLEQMARRIAEAHRREPRHIILGYYNETVSGVFERLGIFEKTRRIREPWLSSLGHSHRYDIKVLETAAR